MSVSQLCLCKIHACSIINLWYVLCAILGSSEPLKKKKAPGSYPMKRGSAVRGDLRIAIESMGLQYFHRG